MENRVREPLHGPQEPGKILGGDVEDVDGAAGCNPQDRAHVGVQVLLGLLPPERRSAGPTRGSSGVGYAMVFCLIVLIELLLLHLDDNGWRSCRSSGLRGVVGISADLGKDRRIFVRASR